MNSIDFEDWYRAFQHISIESCFVPFNNGFLEYLLSDGIHLPLEYKVESQFDLKDLEEMDRKLGNLLKRWKSVFVKVGKSCANDSVWITWNNTLECRMQSDIYMLLKASDRIALEIPRAKGLIVKKWKPVELSSEFRCFVYYGRLVGISQRHLNQMFPYLQNEKQDLMEKLEDFFYDKVCDKFHSEFSYVFDVALDADSIVIIDFDEWNENETSSLLFEWNELQIPRVLEIRIIEKEEDVVLGVSNQNRLPCDFASYEELAKHAQNS